MLLLTVSVPPLVNRSATPPKRRPLSALPVALALVAHGAAIAVLLQIVTQPLHQAAEQSGYAMVLAPPVPPSLVISAPPKPAPAPAPALQSAMAARRLPLVAARAAIAPPQVAAITRRHDTPRRAAPSMASLAAAPPSPPAQVPPLAQPTLSPPGLAQLETRIDQAVRAAATMPPVAIRQRLECRAQVRFDYTDGAVDGVQVVQSSQSRVLDDAAIRAVQHASYPSAPAFLRGRRLGLQVWINFRVAASPG